MATRLSVPVLLPVPIIGQLVLEIRQGFLKQIKMVEEELDETAYWLELIMELELVKPDLLQDLYLENKELLKIVVKSILTMRDKVNGKV